ncbi:hypothetical protein SRHO_G00127180 [Serrasalmus rhombeus]
MRWVTRYVLRRRPRCATSEDDANMQLRRPRHYSVCIAGWALMVSSISSKPFLMRGEARTSLMERRGAAGQPAEARPAQHKHDENSRALHLDAVLQRGGFAPSETEEK